MWSDAMLISSSASDKGWGDVENGARVIDPTCSGSEEAVVGIETARVVRVLTEEEGSSCEVREGVMAGSLSANEGISGRWPLCPPAKGLSNEENLNEDGL